MWPAAFKDRLLTWLRNCWMHKREKGMKRDRKQLVEAEESVNTWFPFRYLSVRFVKKRLERLNDRCRINVLSPPATLASRAQLTSPSALRPHNLLNYWVISTLLTIKQRQQAILDYLTACFQYKIRPMFCRRLEAELLGMRSRKCT